MREQQYTTSQAHEVKGMDKEQRETPPPVQAQVSLLEHAERQRKQRLGYFGRFKEAFFGRQDENEEDGEQGAGVPVSGSPSRPSGSVARFVDAETFEDDADAEGLLTPEQRMKQRRMERIENARVGRPFHERVMLFFLKWWLLLGPIAFVVLTAAEVAYILTHLVAPGDRNGQFIIWAGAIFIELAMMFTTFGVGIKRHEVQEQREAYGHVEESDLRLLRLGTGMWVLFAVINIIGQSAFLLHIILGSHDPNMSVLYVFVASRVVGFILGDAGTAFFLGHVESNDVRLLARAEHERGKLYMELAEAESKRRLLEAEADSKIQLMQIKVEQERADANFLAQLKTQTFLRILEEGGAPNAQRTLPAPSADRPFTGEFQTLDESTESTSKSRLRRLDA